MFTALLDLVGFLVGLVGIALVVGIFWCFVGLLFLMALGGDFPTFILFFIFYFIFIFSCAVYYLYGCVGFSGSNR